MTEWKALRIPADPELPGFVLNRSEIWEPKVWNSKVMSLVGRTEGSARQSPGPPPAARTRSRSPSLVGEQHELAAVDDGIWLAGRV